MTTPKTILKFWATNLDGLSDEAKELRVAGKGYLMHCHLRTRGETILAADKQSDPLMMVGFDGYVISPKEYAVILPLNPTLLERFAIYILKRSDAMNEKPAEKAV